MRLVLKLVIALCISVLMVLSVQALLQARREVDLLESDTIRDNTTTAKFIAQSMGQTWINRGEDAARDFLSNIVRPDGDLTVRFVGLSADAIAESFADMPRTPLEKLRPVAAGGTVGIINPDSPVSEVLTYAPVFVTGSLKGAVEVRETLTSADAFVRSNLLRRVTGAAITLAVITGLSFAYGYLYVARPITKLIRWADVVSAAPNSRDVRRVRQELAELNERPDEVGTLAGALGRMNDRLEAGRQAVERETEAKLAAISAARRADRLAAVGTLASGVAHELGTPLNVIAARARMIQTGESTGTDATRAAAIIAEQAERMGRIIGDLLAFARPRHAERVPTDLPATVARTIELLSPLAAKSRVNLRLTPTEPATLPKAPIDPQQIQQVLINLIVNAIQASPPGGTVQMTVALSSSPGGRQWLITVADEGPGVDGESAQRIFEPFYTTKAPGVGTGLGLAVSQTIAREHGGEIILSTAAPHGAVFTVRLPAEPDSSRADATHPDPDPAQPGRALPGRPQTDDPHPPEGSIP